MPILHSRAQQQAEQLLLHASFLGLHEDPSIRKIQVTSKAMVLGQQVSPSQSMSRQESSAECMAASSFSLLRCPLFAF